MQEVSMRFKVPYPVAKQRLDKLASEFEWVIQHASASDAANKYAIHLEGAKRVLHQCLGDDQDLESFLSETRLDLGSEPNRLEEKKAIQKAAGQGVEILRAWIKIVEQS